MTAVNLRNALVLMLSSVALAVSADERRLSLAEYRDRMEAAWTGQMAGVSVGQPIEVKYNGPIAPREAVLRKKGDEARLWWPEMVNEPIVTRGVPFDAAELPARYASPMVACLALLPALAALVLAWFARREFIVRLIAAMFLVDVGIHFVLFWGMGEAQIYAGHWYYAIPILIGIGLVRLETRPRRLALAAIAAVAVTILALNLHAWFG